MGIERVPELVLLQSNLPFIHELVRSVRVLMEFATLMKRPNSRHFRVLSRAIILFNEPSGPVVIKANSGRVLFNRRRVAVTGKSTRVIAADGGH